MFRRLLVFGSLLPRLFGLSFPKSPNLPFLLIPGVRSGPATVSLDSLNRVDVMRGEETLCLGAKQAGVARASRRRPEAGLALESDPGQF